MIKTQNVIMILKLSNRPGSLAKALAAIAQDGGNISSIKKLTSSYSYITREIIIHYPQRKDLSSIVQTLNGISDVQLLDIADRVCIKHLGGKIKIETKIEVSNLEDLSLVYTPGVASVSEEIHQKPELAYSFTMKGNSVAVITDGSAVLGLGNLGALAALPVMEGKSLLFKKFANIDAFPICLNTQEPEQIINIVAALSPNFGGINLEDIAAPKCFEIEDRLREMLDIPVFHDDQHGTAIVVLAGLINALKFVGKSMISAKLVISGAGAAGVAIVKILKDAGASNIIVCDRKGAITKNKLPETQTKKWIAENTNNSGIQGTLKDVIIGADVFIGVSGPDLLNREDILKMATKPVVFALANPDPEINPEEITDIVGVLATGRSDFPNQINNALAFPGVFRGALDCHAKSINNEMCLAAAYSLAQIITDEQIKADSIIPSIFNDNVAKTIAQSVCAAAQNTGVSRKIPEVTKALCTQT